MRGAIAILIALFIALPASGDPTDDAVRRKIVDTALAFKGVPYVYGAESPSAFDCSGFVRYVYRKILGIELPRSAKGQFLAGVPVPKTAMLAGDVIAFDTVGGAPSHVGIYLGDGSVIHAASAGPRTGVIVSPLKEPYYATRFLGARDYVATARKPEPQKPAVAQPSTPALTPVATPAAEPEQTPLAQIALSITSKPSSSTDKIPAATGTRIQFAVTNDSGLGGTFVILFFKNAIEFKDIKEIHRERFDLPKGAFKELEPYLFTEPGIYRLIVRTHDGIKLTERTFKVIEAGK